MQEVKFFFRTKYTKSGSKIDDKSLSEILAEEEVLKGNMSHKMD